MSIQTTQNKYHRKGMALIIAIIFIALFSSLAIAMLSMSSTNLRVASVHHKSGLALASAQSGLETARYWLAPVCISYDISPSQRFDYVVSSMPDNFTENGVSNITITQDSEGAPDTIGADNITIDSSLGQRFSARVMKTDNLDILQVDITGSGGTLEQTIRVINIYT